MGWFEDLFINEAKPALNRHSSSGSTGPEETIILVDEDGNEVTAVLTDEEVDLNATANDIRLGTTAVTNDGVTSGTKEIPAYHTTEGFEYVSAGEKFCIYIAEANRYDFTKLQAIICPYNTSTSDSVVVEKVSIDGNVYAVGSTDILSVVTVDHDNQCIDLGITNSGTTPYIIRYFTYKEET